MGYKDELRYRLDELGIEYRKKDTVARLEVLLQSDPGPVPEEPAKDPERRTARSFEDVTGLCRQCNRPADHKHIGV